MDEKVLSYHNAYLRVRDVILLQGRNWLNDQIITFYFEFLKTETFRALETCVAFVHPATSYLLEIAGAESLHLAEMLSPLKLNQCDYIFLPINDNVDYTEAEGGSHWSLLVYSAREAVFRHYDSAGINHNWAVGTAKALQTVLASYDSQLESHLEGEDEDTGPNLHEGAGPRQENSWDCGIYVLSAQPHPGPCSCSEWVKYLELISIIYARGLSRSYQDSLQQLVACRWTGKLWTEFLKKT
eukprot:jgi/Botrbrau1/3070/Bobra.0070s0063.1